MSFKCIARFVPVAAAVSLLASTSVFAQTPGVQVQTPGASVQVDGNGVRVRTQGGEVTVGGASNSAAVILGESAPGGMAWGVRKAEDGDVIMAWEKPDTDLQVLSFVCRVADRSLRVTYHVEPENARDGMEVAVSLISESGTAELQMTGRRLQEEMDEFFLQGQTRLTPELARVLTAGPALVITMQGDERTTVLPLAGAAQGVAALVQACGSR